VFTNFWDAWTDPLTGLTRRCMMCPAPNGGGGTIRKVHFTYKHFPLER